MIILVWPIYMQGDLSLQPQLGHIGHIRSSFINLPREEILKGLLDKIVFDILNTY